MYYIISAFIGVVIAISVAINGQLGLFYGTYASAIVIHAVGLAVAVCIALFRREKLWRRLPFYMYLGGAIGMLTVAFNNLAFSKISVSALLALSLLGQTIAALIFDHYGLLGTKKRAFHAKRWIGIGIVCIGIVIMLPAFSKEAIMPVILSFLSGGTIVLARSLNGLLMERLSVETSTLYNYITGIAAAVLLYLLFGGQEKGFAPFELAPNAILYFGGAFGFVVVFLTNVAVRKISAYDMTILTFVGQVFMGIVIDALLTGAFSAHNLIGGVLAAAGFLLRFEKDVEKSDKSEAV